jgi:membrane peptidoglycan carboxypeptidase
LEKTLTKDQILEGYLNLVYYGDRAYGVEAASQHYFGHSAKTLSIAEAALLAGSVQNPGTTDPINYPEKALARRNIVLDRMKELGVITGRRLDGREGA